MFGTFNKTVWRRCMAAIMVAGCAAAPGLAAAATYYVDALAGSDSAAGTSATTAWRTLAKVNATTFNPGDSVLFQTGQSWAGQLHPLGSGTAAAPIVISSYGGGARPIIDGSSLASGGAVYLLNQGGWTIDGLEVVNNSGVDNVGATTLGVNRSGIFVDNESGGVLSGITIRNNYVHDVNGCSACNTSSIDGHINGGIVVAADVANVPWARFVAAGYEGYNNVQILNNTVSKAGREGIVFWDNSVGLSYAAIVPAAMSNNVTIQGNAVYNVDGDGITLSGTQNGLIDHNIVGNAALKGVPGGEVSSGGIWAEKTNGVTMQYNEVYGVLTQQTDGQAFDSDLYASNTLIQYNYSHDNQGGFLLMEGQPMVSGTNLTVRYNLSVNDSWGGVKGVITSEYGPPGTVNIYNNTIYIAAGLPSNPILCNSCNASWMNFNIWNFDNNVIANFGSGNYTNPAGWNVAFSNNLYFGNHPSGEPGDARKLVTDPQFVAAAATAPYGIAAVAGYQISSGSPAASSGVAISGNGGHDYFGRPVSATAAPTRGFYEAVNY